MLLFSSATVALASFGIRKIVPFEVVTVTVLILWNYCFVSVLITYFC